MRTVNQIIDELGTIALDHRFINSFKEGEMSEGDIQKLAGNKYPICYADISGATIEKGSTNSQRAQRGSPLLTVYVAATPEPPAVQRAAPAVSSAYVQPR